MQEPLERNFSMWRYHNSALDDLDSPEQPEKVISDQASLERWQRRFRRKLRSAIGPHRPVGELHVEVAEMPLAGDRGFDRFRVVYRSEPRLDTPAWLLVPHRLSDPAPAVLVVHGHGPEPWVYDYGRDVVCGPSPTDPSAAAAIEAQCPAFGAELARRGFVVLAPDLRGFGERWDRWPEGHRMCDFELAQHLSRGELPLAGNLRDLVAAVDVLLDHELVDAGRVGVAGFSLGGTMAMFLAALDERVAATVVSGAFSDPRAAARVPFDVCGSQVLPGLVRDFDHVQLAALVAPRALFVETGEDDFLWPADAARAAAERTRGIYSAVGARGRFRADRFAGSHRWNGEVVLSALASELSGEAG